MVPHPQLRPRQVPQRAPTRPATTPTGGLTLHAKVEPTPHRLKLFGSNCRIWDNPTLPPSINLPPGFTASVFAKNLNMPTGIAFLGNSSSFQVFVLESGHGLPSVCNNEMAWPGGPFDINNPFTPDILVFNQNGTKIRGPLGKPTSSGGGFQPSGPAI